MNSKSKELFKRARRYIPGGVNSPVRSYKAVNGQPIYIAKAQGSHIWDVDGNEYIDYVCSWGALILGHASPQVIEALQLTAAMGTSFGANSEIEVKIAEQIVQLIPSIDKVRMVNSGTEATMTAVRLARAFTKRDKIMKFAGCYHGHADGFLCQTGSGAMTLSLPNSAGVTEGIAKDTLVAQYNDLDSVRTLIAAFPDQIAAIIVEPVAANMGVVLPQPEFLPGLRQLADKNGIILIFDEVITGFRLGLRGAQSTFAINPDLTTLGKIIGGGLPVGAIGGKKEIMDLLAPDGPVYQAGTLSGNPLALTAGYETISELQAPGFYENLNHRAEKFFKEIAKICVEIGLPTQINHITSIGSLFFIDREVWNYHNVLQTDRKLFTRYFRAMLSRGIYLPPSPYEAMFISAAHSHEDLERALDAHDWVIKKRI